MVVEESADGQAVELAAGEALTVRLAENPTTGFRWTLVSDGTPACTPNGDSYRVDGSRVGQGGHHDWHFEATQPGQGTIALAYSRPWESGPPGRTFKLEVSVR